MIVKLAFLHSVNVRGIYMYLGELGQRQLWSLRLRKALGLRRFNNLNYILAYTRSFAASLRYNFFRVASVKASSVPSFYFKANERCFGCMPNMCKHCATWAPGPGRAVALPHYVWFLSHLLGTRTGERFGVHFRRYSRAVRDIWLLWSSLQ